MAVSRKNIVRLILPLSTPSTPNPSEALSTTSEKKNVAGDETRFGMVAGTVPKFVTGRPVVASMAVIVPPLSVEPTRVDMRTFDGESSGPLGLYLGSAIGPPASVVLGNEDTVVPLSLSTPVVGLLIVKGSNCV
jgi:hypothetical protein